MGAEKFKFNLTARLDDRMWFIEPTFGTDGVPTSFQLHEGCVAEIQLGTNATTMFSMIKCNDMIATIPQELAFRTIKTAFFFQKELTKEIKERRMTNSWIDDVMNVIKLHVSYPYGLFMSYGRGDKMSPDDEVWYEIERVGIQIVSKKFITNKLSHVYYYCTESRNGAVVGTNVQVDSSKLGVHNHYEIQQLISASVEY